MVSISLGLILLLSHLSSINSILLKGLRTNLSVMQKQVKFPPSLLHSFSYPRKAEVASFFLIFLLYFSGYSLVWANITGRLMGGYISNIYIALRTGGNSCRGSLILLFHCCCQKITCCFSPACCELEEVPETYPLFSWKQHKIWKAGLLRWPIHPVASLRENKLLLIQAR